jgi:hypothetical protein
MEKHKTIQDLLNGLKPIIEAQSLEIVDYWDADLCAIGLKKSGKLAYISTFNYIEDKIMKYDFDLEMLDNLDNGKVVKNGRGVDRDELALELSTFF